MKNVALSILVFFTSSFPSDAAIDACGNNQKARQLVELIMKDADQKRVKLSCNILLTQAAKDKAELMAETGMVMHNLGGSPNSRLREKGYKLPPYYGSAFSNQVEAIAGGYETVKEVWKGFKNSPTHAEHLLGNLPFYQEQDEIGVAYINKWHSPHVDYWVVYLSKGFVPNQSGKFKKGEVPNKGNLILHKNAIVTDIEAAALDK